MNSNLSAYIRDYAVTATIKNRMTRFLCAGVALLVVSGGIPPAGADDNNGFLPNQMIVSTVPPNGDLNPYGVAFVPQDFQRGNGPLQPGDILVSNFNNSSNLQGTGTTIVRVSRSGAVSLFFTAAPPRARRNRQWPIDSSGSAAQRLHHCRKRAIDRWDGCNCWPRWTTRNR